MSCGKSGFKGDLTGLLLEEAPAESERLKRKSTGKFNRACSLKQFGVF